MTLNLVSLTQYIIDYSEIARYISMATNYIYKFYRNKMLISITNWRLHCVASHIRHCFSTNHKSLLLNFRKNTNFKYFFNFFVDFKL